MVRKDTQKASLFSSHVPRVVRLVILSQNHKGSILRQRVSVLADTPDRNCTEDGCVASGRSDIASEPQVSVQWHCHHLLCSSVRASSWVEQRSPEKGATSWLTRELLLPSKEGAGSLVSGNCLGNGCNSSMTVPFSQTQESGLPRPSFPCGLLS